MWMHQVKIKNSIHPQHPKEVERGDSLCQLAWAAPTCTCTSPKLCPTSGTLTPWALSHFHYLASEHVFSSSPFRNWQLISENKSTFMYLGGMVYHVNAICMYTSSSGTADLVKRHVLADGGFKIPFSNAYIAISSKTTGIGHQRRNMLQSL